MRNDPAFIFERQQKKSNTSVGRSPVVAKKSEVTDTEMGELSRCPVHNSKHTLNECHAFRLKTLPERKNFLKEKKICERCCASNSHESKNCTVPDKCDICGYKNPPHGTSRQHGIQALKLWRGGPAISFSPVCNRPRDNLRLFR